MVLLVILIVPTVILLVSVKDTVYVSMEDGVYSIHLLIIILVIVLALDTGEETVPVSDSKLFYIHYCFLFY